MKLLPQAQARGPNVIANPGPVSQAQGPNVTANPGAVTQAQAPRRRREQEEGGGRRGQEKEGSAWPCSLAPDEHGERGESPPETA